MTTRQDSKSWHVVVAGWGKTRLGVLVCLETALRGGRAWWVAPSYKLAAVGWRGVTLLARQIPGADVRQSDRLVQLSTGGTVQVRSADDPQSLRGEGLDFVVLDECAYMKPEAWTEALRPALSDRKGGALFISTPRGLNWFRDLWLLGQLPDQSEWRSWSFKTVDNPFIDPAEIEAARAILPSRVFRQEYEADFMEDAPGALWKREWLDAGRVTAAPELARIVVGVDPSATSTGDACGIIVAGITAARPPHLYVLDDLTLQGSPEIWAQQVVAAFNKYHADVVVAEANQGGEMVTAVLQQVQRHLPVRLVRATRGKLVRAEPVSIVYEQGRGHHVGRFQELEDELCQYEPGDPSPNRLDALVWAGTQLLESRGGARSTG